MGDIVDIKNIRQKNRESIEKKAFKRFNIIKVNDSLYLYPESRFITGKMANVFLARQNVKVEDMLEDVVIEQINQLVPDSRQKITVMLQKQTDEDILTFEIYNINTGKNFLLQTPMKYNVENRRFLTALIAGAINKREVFVTFMLPLNYKDVKGMVENNV